MLGRALKGVPQDVCRRSSVVIENTLEVVFQQSGMDSESIRIVVPSECLRHATVDLMRPKIFLHGRRGASHILLVRILLDFRYLRLPPGVLDWQIFVAS